MKRKHLLVLGALLMVLGAGVAYAGFTIYSDGGAPVHVTINYTLGLTNTVSGSSVHLTAHLESSGNPMSGASITFYTCDINGNNRGIIGSSVTNPSGDATVDYNLITANGEYYFIASYDVP